MSDVTSDLTPTQSLDLVVSTNSIPSSLHPTVRDLLRLGCIELIVRAGTNTLWPLLAKVRTSTGWQSTLSAGITTSSGRPGRPGVGGMEDVRIRFILESGNAGSRVEGYSALPGDLSEAREGALRKFLSRGGG